MKSYFDFKHSENAAKVITEVMSQLDALGESEHGGYYYDSDDLDILHVNIVNDIRTQILNPLLPLNELQLNYGTHIKFHKVKYTMAQLRELQHNIDQNLLGRCGTNLSKCDVIKNVVFIGANDVSQESQDEIVNELAKIGCINRDMYEIGYRERTKAVGSELDFSDSPVDCSHGFPDRVIDRATILACPGGWLGMGASAASIISISSMTTGFLYNNQPGFLSCGHGKVTGSKIYYQPVPSSGSYPSDIWNFSSSKLVELGPIAACSFQSGDPYDYASIQRTNSNVNMNPKNYAGGGIDGDTGIPVVNSPMAASGCSSKYVSGKCIGNSVSVFAGDILKTDMLEMNKPLNSGTSGGCVAYMNSNNKTMLTGIVNSTTSTSSYHAKYSLVKSKFNLTTVF